MYHISSIYCFLHTYVCCHFVRFYKTFTRFSELKVSDGIENGEITQEARDEVDGLLKQSFRPEFLNRLDEVLEFDSLSRDQIAAIVKLQLKDLQKRLADEQFSLEVDDSAMEILINDGYDPAYGARPVKRAIQRDLENPIAKLIVAGKYPPGSTIHASAKDGLITIS
jgi:ATP-dependent Clp protease ATP-binding subunit ClpB